MFERDEATKCWEGLMKPMVYLWVVVRRVFSASIIFSIVSMFSLRSLAFGIGGDKYMGFVNEYATDKDIEEFKLHEIWDHYHPYRKGEYYGGDKPSFTIDRQRNIFFMVIARGIREEGNQVTFLLWWNGDHVTGRLKQDGGSSELDARPFYRVWHLLNLDRPQETIVLESEVKKTLKDALRSYGYWGAKQQIPNTVVNFKF